MLTGAGVKAEVGTSDFDGGHATVDEPLLSLGAVAVVADGQSALRTHAFRPQDSHLDGGTVSEDTTLDIEALRGVAVRVDLVVGVRDGAGNAYLSVFVSLLCSVSVRLTSRRRERWQCPRKPRRRHSGCC